MVQFLKSKIHLLSELITKLFQTKSLKGKIVKGSLGNFIIYVGNKIIILLTGVGLVRILGKAEYGIYSYLLSFVNILVIPAEFGLSTLIIRETAKGLANQKNRVVKGIWRWSFGFTIFLSIILLSLAAVGSFWAKRVFNQLEMSTFYWAMLLLPIQALVYIGMAALQGLNKVLIGQLPNLIITPGLFAISFLIISLLKPFELTSASSMTLRLFATIIGLLFTIYFLVLKTPSKVRNAKPFFREKMWLVNVAFLGMSGGFFALRTHLSTLIMGLFVDASQIGVFQIAVSTAALSGLALQTTNAILAPIFAALITKNDKRNLQKLVRTNSLIVSVFAFIIALIFLIFGKPLLGFAFGPGLVEAYPSLLILLVGQLVNSFAGPVAYLLNMAGYEKDVLKITGISTILISILTLTITPVWGIIGGAIASSATLIIAQFVMYKLVHNKLGIVSHMFGRIKQHDEKDEY
jgi:O-antigen/teichoic acid export membrane protein